MSFKRNELLIISAALNEYWKIAERQNDPTHTTDSIDELATKIEQFLRSTR